MPLYAYIKIPDIQNSGSTDEVYGKEWIPLNSIKLSGSSLGDDEAIRAEEDARAKLRENEARIKKIKKIQQRIDKSRGEDIPPLQAKIAKLSDEFRQKNEKSARPAPATPRDDDDDAFASITGNEHSCGAIEISKTLDATSPSLHLLCLQSQQYDSDKYIKGPVEIHICRHIPAAKNDGVERQTYMAYTLENCLITDLDVNASEHSVFEETLTLSFEKIHFSILHDGRWDTETWDFCEDEESKSTIDPKPPG